MSFFFSGAGDEARTRYLHLGKVALYRMSYTRIWGLFLGTCCIIAQPFRFVNPLFCFFGNYSAVAGAAG